MYELRNEVPRNIRGSGTKFDSCSFMRIAIPHWQGRVSPVFDVATNVWVIEVGSGVERSRRDTAFHAEQPQARAIHLAQTGVEVLICGAISRPLEMAVESSGIRVIPQTCGNIDAVLAAFLAGKLQGDAFLMPGCCGRRRRNRGQGTVPCGS